MIFRLLHPWPESVFRSAKWLITGEIGALFQAELRLPGKKAVQRLSTAAAGEGASPSRQKNTICFVDIYDILARRP